jgi:hypothetical protein
MTRVTKFGQEAKVWLLAIVIASAISISCNRKPAYSDVEPEKGRAQASGQAEQSPQTPASSEPAAAPAPPPAAPLPQDTVAKKEFKLPAFIDDRTGEIKDLPSYPNAIRTNASVGPIQDVEAATYVLEAGDSIEMIASFYDAAIRKNGWRVAARSKEADYFKLEMTKGGTSEAIVEARRDPSTNRRSIVLSRVERPKGQ